MQELPKIPGQNSSTTNAYTIPRQRRNNIIVTEKALQEMKRPAQSDSTNSLADLDRSFSNMGLFRSE